MSSLRTTHKKDFCLKNYIKIKAISRILFAKPEDQVSHEEQQHHWNNNHWQDENIVESPEKNTVESLNRQKLGFRSNSLIKIYFFLEENNPRETGLHIWRNFQSISRPCRRATRYFSGQWRFREIRALR